MWNFLIPLGLVLLMLLVSAISVDYDNYQRSKIGRGTRPDV